jgi:iron complex outermembrane receptor protein
MVDRVLLWFFAVCLATIISGVRADDMIVGDELVELSLEELLNTEITTLSRKAESLGSAPAAVHVITRSDIRRSGARSIPELLRLVPGMQVAQLDGNKWAVTARGANGRYAPRLLVLMDGRTLYNPMLSGVLWDVQDTDMSAIERIEVIRGPGATMWGSNAVNGIVNIITKHAADTQGGNIGVVGGQQGYETVLRYGVETGDSALRLFGKYYDRDGNVNLSGADTEDRSEMVRFGGRYDWDGNDSDTFTLTFEVYEGDAGDYRTSRMLTPPYEVILDTNTDTSGEYIMGHWSRKFSETSALEVRAYYDSHARDAYTVTEDVDTFDVDLQHSFSLGERQEWIWGLSYRSSSDEATGTFEIQILPSTATNRRISAFVHDEISLLDGRARLMLGSKFEHNEASDSNIEVEPSVRMSFNVSDNRAFWAAVSQSVRVPSRGERGGGVVTAVIPPGMNPMLPVPIPTAVVLRGNPALISEDVTAYEAGYRMRNPEYQLDISVFYNVFSKLRSIMPGLPTCEPGGVSPLVDPTCLFASSHVEAPLVLGNDSNYDAMGLEIWMSKQLSERWRVQGGYTYFRSTDGGEGSIGETLEFPEDSPEHQVSLRSSVDINESLELDLLARWVDELEFQQIDAYAAVDFRLAWTPIPGLSVAAVGRNLFAGDHVEFISELSDLAPIQIEPEGFIELRWNF